MDRSEANVARVALDWSRTPWAYRALEWPGDGAHVMFPREACPALDGLSASTCAEEPGNGFVWKGADAVGRSIQLRVEPAEEGEGLRSGSVRRCTPLGCETSVIEAGPILAEESKEVDNWLPLAEFKPTTWGESAVAAVATAGAWVAVARGTAGLVLLRLEQRAEGEPVLREVTHWLPEAGELWNDVEILEQTLWVASSRRGLLTRSLPEAGLEDPDLSKHLRSDWELGTEAGGNVHTLTLIGGDGVLLARLAPTGGLLWWSGETREVETIPSFAGCPEVHRASVLQGSFTDPDSAVTVGLACFNMGLGRLTRRQQNWEFELLFEERGAHSVAALPGLETAFGYSSEGFAGRARTLAVETPAEAGAVWGGDWSAAASAHHFECRGARCWVAHYQRGLLEVDLSHLMRPVTRRAWRGWRGPGQRFFEGVADVALNGPYLLVADTESGLLVFSLLSADAYP